MIDWCYTARGQSVFGPGLSPLFTVKSGDEAVVVGIISVTAFFDGCFSAVVYVLFGWCKENVIAPTPTNKLTQLLEDQEVEDTSCSNFFIVIAWNLIPMKSFKGLR